MMWSVTPTFRGANHKPTVKLEGPLDITVKAGETVKLSASTTDPDGDSVSVKWWQYRSAGTYPGQVEITNPSSRIASFVIPGDAQPGATIHVVVEATDSGTPAMTHYQEVIVTVQ